MYYKEYSMSMNELSNYPDDQTHQCTICKYIGEQNYQSSFWILPMLESEHGFLDDQNPTTIARTTFMSWTTSILTEIPQALVWTLLHEYSLALHHASQVTR